MNKACNSQTVQTFLPSCIKPLQGPPFLLWHEGMIKESNDIQHLPLRCVFVACTEPKRKIVFVYSTVKLLLGVAFCYFSSNKGNQNVEKWSATIFQPEVTKSIWSYCPKIEEQNLFYLHLKYQFPDIMTLLKLFSVPSVPSQNWPARMPQHKELQILF